MRRRDCRRRAEKQNNNGRQGDSVLKGGGEGGWGRPRDRASKGSSGSCDSLGPTLMYATTVWQRCVISLCVCVLLLGCSPSHTHFSTLFRAGGEKLRKVRIAQRELVVFLCTHCTCAYTTIHSMLYMECCTLCTRNCFILRYTSCPWRCRKGCLIFSPAKLFHFHFGSRSCARLAVIGFQNEIHLMANEALIYAIHVVKACGS